LGVFLVRKLSWLLAVAMVTSLVWTPTSAFAWAPTEGATFNVPRPYGTDAQRYKIIKRIERAIDETPRAREGEPQPVILISTYLLDRKESVNGLIKACKRGVSVRVIIDEGIESRISKKLIRALNADNVESEDDEPTSGPCGEPLGERRRAAEPAPLTDRQARLSVMAPLEDSVTWGGDRSYVTVCSGTCRGGKGNMHSKFFAFSRTGTAEHVITVSSSNLNRGGALNGWNDAYTMVGRPRSYQVYRRVHREMTEDKRTDGKLVEVVDGPFTSRFMPIRPGGKSNDPTLKDLRKIRCNSDLGRTKVHISMFFWEGTRGDYLADKVLGLARDGCKVSIILGAPSIAIAQRLRAAARAGLIGLWDSRTDINGDGERELRTHCKYVLVKGAFGSDRRAKVVMTGSMNWGNGSLTRSDETSLNIAKASAYTQYLGNWQDIKQKSRRIPAPR
jgi:phosphatidylserine/phosphatidylglycerophosphate/cardiolipin synthase-like enzyme